MHTYISHCNGDEGVLIGIEFIELTFSKKKKSIHT